MECLDYNVYVKQQFSNNSKINIKEELANV